jgi:hypothetical protein
MTNVKLFDNNPHSSFNLTLLCVWCQSPADPNIYKHSLRALTHSALLRFKGNDKLVLKLSKSKDRLKNFNFTKMSKFNVNCPFRTALKWSHIIYGCESPPCIPYTVLVNFLRPSKTSHFLLENSN